MFVLLTALSLFPLMNGGTLCPPRERIYPCVCTEIPQTKKTFFTLVTCRGIPDVSVLDSVSWGLRDVEIDRFMMVDCFLEAGKVFGKDGDAHQRLPTDWWSTMRIRELEIMDSVLSPGFACEASGKCLNSHQTHLSIVNSSFTPTVQNVCEVSKTVKFSWTACLGKLKHFDFRGNRLTSVGISLFPMAMRHLEVLNLSHNAIQTLETEVFRNLPMLTELDLSHNEIKRLPSNLFGHVATQLTILDLSFNQLTAVPKDIHRLTPNLKTLNLRQNLIRVLGEKEWTDLSSKKSVRLIDLRENMIFCDCYLSWLNASLHINAVVLGTCAEPKEYVQSPIRRASRLLSSRCNSTIQSIAK